MPTMKIFALMALAAAIATPALAGHVTYTVSGTGAGRYLDLSDPNATVTPFGPEPIAFVGHGVTPPSAAGNAIFVPLVAGEIDGLIGNASILIGVESAFAVVGAANEALFGDYNGTDFTPSILFSGLGNYNGTARLAATPITVVAFAPFPFTASGNLYGVQFDSFVDATFTAAVPEPASWALMIAGFGLTGSAVRRRRVAVRAV